MKSQTSFYNRSLIVSNLKRHGYFGIIFFIISAAISNVGVLANLVGRYKPVEMDSYRLELIYVNAWDIFMVFLVPVILSIVLFRYLQEERALSAIHSMPLSRKSLFVSQCITFEMIFGLPVILNGLIAFGILLIKGYPIGFVISLIFVGILKQIVAGTAVFGLATISGMIVGSSVLQVALAGVLMGAPFVIVELTKVLIDWALLGYPHTMSEEALHVLITPFAVIPMVLGNILEHDVAMTKGSMIIVIMMVVSILLSYWLYQKRDLERHHDLIVFNWAKKAFIALLTVLITLALAGLIGSIMGASTTGGYIGLIIGSSLGYFITKMIAEKTVSVIKFYKEGMMVVLSFLVVMVMIDLDVVGYESRVPDTDEVEAVYYSASGWLSVDDVFEESATLVNDQYGTAVFNERTSIDAVKALHRSLFDDSHSDYVIHRDTVLVYQLKNGKIIHRKYSTDIDLAYLETIHELPEYKRESMEHLANVIHNSENVDVTISTPNGTSRSITKGEYDSLLTAYAADFQAMSFFEEFVSDQWGSLEVRVFGDKHGDGINEWYDTNQYLSFRIRPGYYHTFTWMQEHDMENLTFSLEDVSYVTISERHQMISPYISVEPESNLLYEDMYRETKAIPVDGGSIKDPDMIKTLYDLGHDYSRMYEAGYSVNYYLQGGGSYSYRIVDLPEAYESYVAPIW